MLHSSVTLLAILQNAFALTSRGKSLKTVAKSFQKKSSLLYRMWVGMIKERMSVRPRIAWDYLILQLPYWMYYVSTYLLWVKWKCPKLRIVYCISQTGLYCCGIVIRLSHLPLSHWWSRFKPPFENKHQVEMGSICDEESTGIIAVETQ